MCLVQKIDKYISDMNNLIILKKIYLRKIITLESTNGNVSKKDNRKRKMKNKYFHTYNYMKFISAENKDHPHRDSKFMSLDKKSFGE